MTDATVDLLAVDRVAYLDRIGLSGFSGGPSP
jgi:hypothetical protein